MCYFNRWNVVEAYYWYDVLWAPSEYSARLHALRFRPGGSARLENADEDVKSIYGRLVMKHNRLWIGYERYRRRHPSAPSWPGTQNMRCSAREWLQAHGLLDAVRMMTRNEA